jgi:hypothetical protein
MRPLKPLIFCLIFVSENHSRNSRPLVPFAVFRRCLRSCKRLRGLAPIGADPERNLLKYPGKSRLFEVI